MGVLVSKRGESTVQYLTTAVEFREAVIKLARKFPKSYRYAITNKMLEMAADLQHELIKANNIYMHEKMSVSDYELRHRYLVEALGNLSAVSTDLKVCDDMLSNDHDGQTFKTKEDQYNAFYKLSQLHNQLHKLVKGVLDSDKRKWKTWHPEMPSDMIEEKAKETDIEQLDMEIAIEEDTEDTQ